MSDGPSSSEIRQNPEDFADVSVSKRKTPRINLGRKFMQSASRAVRGILKQQISTEPEEIFQPNATANSYITEEAEDQKLLEQLEQVDPLEKQLAILQEKIQQSTLPTLDKFPPEFTEALLRDRKVFNQLMVKRHMGGDINLDRIPVINIPYVEKGHVFGLMSRPKEYLLEYVIRAKKIFQLYGGQSLFAVDLLKEAIESTDWQLRNENGKMQLTEELKNGDHYLSHGVVGEGVNNVFESGYFCSIQSQLDRFGKAYVTTFDEFGPAIEYHDRFVAPSNIHRMNDLVLPKNNEVNNPAHKNLLNMSKKERYEILFAEDGFYYGLNVVNFVFPAGELLQNTSWYEQAGVRLFTKDYNHGEKRKGYEISLKDTPHLVITASKNRSQVLELVAKADWIKDKDEYIRNNVIFLDSGQLGKNVVQQIRDIARDKFKGQDYSNLGAHVVPTGVELDPEETCCGRVHLMKRV